MTEAQQPQPQGQIHVLSQFIKDLSFESPNPPGDLANGNFNINVNVNARPLKDLDHEVTLKFDVTLVLPNNNTAYRLELSYCAMIRLENVPAEQAGGAVMVAAPAILFPFARLVMTNTIMNAGYPPLMINPIDFGALAANSQAHQARQAAQAQELATAPVTPVH